MRVDDVAVAVRNKVAIINDIVAAAVLVVVVIAVDVGVMVLAVLDKHDGGLTRWEHCRSNAICWLLHSATGPWQQRTLFSAGATHTAVHPASV